MGCCLSTPNPSHPPPLSNLEPETLQPNAESKIPPPTQLKEIAQISDFPNTEKKPEHQTPEQEQKKEIEAVIQPRKSHDKKPDPKGSLRSDSSEPESNNTQKSLASNIMEMAASGGAVRTSSCTKEEVDAILIQCGRLSRSSSGNRKYSGSKRSHDFDKEHTTNSIPIELNCDENGDDERQRRRQSRGSHRRSTSSRSRERDPQAQKSAGGGRRLSRSPAKRSAEPPNNNNNTTNSASGGNTRPGKLVSVPATVSSLSMEKSNNGGEGGGNNVKRVLVRRNVTPPRSRSPARSTLVGSNGVRTASSNQNQPSPSRNLSRKTDHSPYRRTPLTDLDMNSLPFQPLGNNKSSSVKGNQKINGDVSAKQHPLTSASQSKVVGVVQGTHRRARSRGGEGNDATTEAVSGPNNTLTRTRSSRRSRDLDVESLSNTNPATNYTSLLLQDIQNFHQKSSATTSTNAASAPPFKLPECVSKACSIVEAVADLNLNSCSTRPVGRVSGGDDDLMEPSLQKFVTVEKRREIDEKEESSGSNSVVVGNGGQNQWVSSSASSWGELGSEGVSPASIQRLATVSSSSRSGVGRSGAGNGR